MGMRFLNINQDLVWDYISWRNSFARCLQRSDPFITGVHHSSDLFRTDVTFVNE